MVEGIARQCRRRIDACNQPEAPARDRGTNPSPALQAGEDRIVARITPLRPGTPCGRPKVEKSRTMPRTWPFLAAAGMIVAAGVVHGLWTDRWGKSRALEDAAARVESERMP